MTEAEWFACGDIDKLVFRLPSIRAVPEQRFRDMAHAWVDRVRLYVPRADDELVREYRQYERWLAGLGDHPRPPSSAEFADFDPLAVQRIDGPPINSVIENLLDGSFSLAALFAHQVLLTGPDDPFGIPDKDQEKWLDEEFLGQFHDIVGNPFRPVAFDPAWRTSAGVGLAQAMDDARDFAAMPILADALQGAGCEDGAILGHCRGDGPHVRGCWVVDLVLAKA